MAWWDNIVGLATSNCLLQRISDLFLRFLSVLIYHAYSCIMPGKLFFTEERKATLTALVRKHRSSVENKKTDAVSLIPLRNENEKKILGHCTLPSDCFGPASVSQSGTSKRTHHHTRTLPHEKRSWRNLSHSCSLRAQCPA